MLGAAFLDDRDDHRKARERPENRRLDRRAEQEIDQPADQQQAEHGLTKNVRDDRQFGPATGRRQGVGPIRGEPGGGLGRRQAGRRRSGSSPLRHRGFKSHSPSSLQGGVNALRARFTKGNYGPADAIRAVTGWAASWR